MVTWDERLKCNVNVFHNQHFFHIDSIDSEFHIGGLNLKNFRSSLMLAREGKHAKVTLSSFLDINHSEDNEIPFIKNPDFNPHYYLFFYYMNKFWIAIFKKLFINDRIKVRNMLAMQEVLFNSVSMKFVPKFIKHITKEKLLDVTTENIIDRDMFSTGNEKTLLDFVESTDKV